MGTGSHTFAEAQAFHAAQPANAAWALIAVAEAESHPTLSLIRILELQLEPGADPEIASMVEEIAQTLYPIALNHLEIRKNGKSKNHV